MTQDSTATALSHEAVLADVPDVLAAWEVIASEPVNPVDRGTLNWNFDVRAGAARYFLRCYRANLETERIAGEQELVSWAFERGIPAPVAIPTPAGETLLVRGSERWALLPWMPGLPKERGALSAPQARSLGDMHGRLQAVLAQHPLGADATFTQRWDKSQSLTILSNLATTARSKGIEDWIVAGIDKQRRLLERLEVLPPAAFAPLPCQVLHGDFHDQQVLFDGDSVTAVVDWEIWQTGARAWELMRALAFSQVLDSPLLAPYLEGYRQHVRLSEDEARLALRLWFQSRVVGLWAWWAHVMEGNERVKDFFPAMIAELDNLADGSWSEAIIERVVAAACA